MSSVSDLNHESNIDRVISYWFAGPDAHKKWFGGGPSVDAEIKDQFSPLVLAARSSQLESWRGKPDGELALVLLLDQFPRNIFRGTPESFSSDSMALEVSTEAIAKGLHRQVPHGQEMFFYYPFMHDEKLISHVADVALWELWKGRCEGSAEMERAEESLSFARRHMETIVRFGRYPSRNKILGRESTEEEVKFLEEKPSGF